ncbi:group II intron reverse transcriptase/maturase (plasmid) [Agrobacterium vitis]|uniref:group II intron reverse transcriptase/maturase n=1 Tax=Agrobacterium vitis TaxID=373 RepID=UPI0015D8FAB3|nr:group II intron reverse transcriptase/maturase [Agrobacterium vitis]BCH62508.1 group II intron reverse transcriptase/maturase [Agrobacterium vitis]
MTVTTVTGAASREAVSWDQIDWRKAYQHVRWLQMRIAKAVREGRWGKVKVLQRLLTHSFSGKALAVKRVTGNQGKRTPGVDRIIWDTPDKCVRGLLSLKRRGYHPLPLRRVYIPKANSKKLRPLGIPTMKDRAMQALHLLALLPVAETTADPNSYGFRPFRATRDAARQCYIALRGRGTAEWVLDADIAGCFDEISKDWLIANIPMDKVVLRKWLDSGYIQDGDWHATKAGTPQGGIISPTLANMALDGMEKMLRDFYGPRRRNSLTKVHLIRYADDFVVTGASKEVLEEAKSLVEDFLSERGLSLSEEKTRIVRVEEGFDFLGWNVRRYDGHTHIKPAKKNVAAFMRKIRTIIKGAADVKQEYLIMRLNPVIRGWTNYHHNQVAKETFRKVDHLIWKCLWQWACRRHPDKPLRWVKYRYFAREGTRDWVFRTGMKDKAGNLKFIRLIHASDVPIRRHCKIRAEANPFDPMWDSYFAGRRGMPSEVTDRPGDSTSQTDAQELAALVKQGLAEA